MSGSVPLEVENTGSLSHTYCWGKTPLEVLVEIWLTSSVKDRELALISRWYVIHGDFLELLHGKWCSSRLETGVSGNLWSFVKEVKPLVVYNVEMWDCYGVNALEMVFISSWFGVHWALLSSWGDISDLLVLWQCSWWLSGVPSSKLRLLTCLIWGTELLCTQCRGNRPHLAARGKSHGFSRVAAENWVIFSSYGGDSRF